MTGRPAREVTIEDIGRELGLSAMTVSRALNGHPNVKQETRFRVLQHAENLNYRPNRWARSLATSKSNVIGIVVPDITHSYFSEITQVVQEKLEQQGYALMLCHTDGNPAREKSSIDMLLGSRVDGLLIASSFSSNDPGLFQGLRNEGMPFVLLDRFFDKLSCARVRTDDVLVGRLATKCLIDHGHRSIGLIRGPEVISTGHLRTEGFLRTMSENALPLRQEWLVDSNYRFDGGYEAMCTLLRLEKRPTAIFAGNDPAAIGAIRACRDFGLQVPQDISVIGAGSIEGSYHANPFVATVDWSRQEMGTSAAELLLRQIQSGSEPTDIDHVCVPRLLLRASVGAYNAAAVLSASA